MTPVLLLFGLLALSAAMLTAWFTFELILLKLKAHPITWYDRTWVNRHWYTAAATTLVGAFAAGVAATHFFLDAPCQPFGH